MLKIMSRCCLMALLWMMATDSAQGVTSKIHRHSSETDLSKGKGEGVVIGSRGTLTLGRSDEVLADDFENVWSVNSILTRGSTVYFSTSPNGGIYRYSFGALTRIYPVDSPSAEKPADDLVDPNDTSRITNEHVFALGMDVSGRLLAGFSGVHCRLCRFSTSGMDVLFEPKDDKYIFDITTDEAGNIYLATGPEGKVYRMDPLGKTAQLVYDSRDKNMLSLVAGVDGFLYAGSDDRGLVYKLNPRNQTATVLYDSIRPEVTALLFDQVYNPAAKDLYAIATSAEVAKTERDFAAQAPRSGRPESESGEGDAPDEQEQGGLELKIANTKKAPAEKKPSGPRPIRKGPRSETTSMLYRIDHEGYVKTVMEKMAVFLCLSQCPDGLLIGTGNDAELLLVNPETEQRTVLYQDEQAQQVTSLGVTDEAIYMGTANPAKLVQLKKTYTVEGTYVSELIDAEQPARWGKLQIDAEVPSDCKVLVSCRSGNVGDVNDPTFSPWTDPEPVTEPVQLKCPLGRFCQYKLILQSQSGEQSPVIREVAVASTIPNLAPVVESVDVEQHERSSRKDMFRIQYKAADENDDTLSYTIYLRKVGRSFWIKLKDNVDEDTFDWDSRTVEDGRYEIRVVASDHKTNTSATALTGSRISDPVVVDNTGPVVRGHFIEQRGPVTVLGLRIGDVFSAIGKLDYTLDADPDWQSSVPEDLVYDTTDEDFEIHLEGLSPGDHIVTVRIADALDNVTFRSFDIQIPDKQ